MPLESLAEENQLDYWSLEDIKALKQNGDGAFYVALKDGESWDFRIRITREFRKDETKAQHPHITASNGQEKIGLVLSKSHGWYIQFHNGDMAFNRQVLRFLNKGELSVAEDVLLTLREHEAERSE